MRKVLMVLILICCLVLPGTLFHFWSWAGIKPDLAMLWVIYLALHHRLSQSLGYGLATGLIVDFYLGHNIGLYALTLTVVSLLASLIQRRWYKDNIPLIAALVFIVTLLGQTMVFLIALTAGLNWFFGDAFKLIVGIAFYNSLLVPITYPLIHKSFTEGLLRQKKEYELF